MMDRKTSAQEVDCDELRDALERLQSSLATEQRNNAPIVQPGALPLDPPDQGTDDVAEEIRRLQQAMEEAGCND
jgi:hypothetical protein